MNVKDAIFARRSIRKFTQEKPDKDALLTLVDCARVAAYGANMQPLKFRLITEDNEVDAIFPTIKWAGYLKDGAPKDGEQPRAYIALFGDLSVRSNGAFETDAGAAVTNMMLEAVELGLATCWLGAIDRNKIAEILNVPENLKVLYLLAVGYGAQDSKIIEMQDGDVKYFVDETGTVNVPKRSLEDVLV